MADSEQHRVYGSFLAAVVEQCCERRHLFGDSGGPNFRGDTMVVAGVTSFGLNGSCGGTGGVFRLDRVDVQAFINGFIADHP